MKNSSRLDDIVRIIANDRLPVGVAEPAIRTLNDQDIDWLIARITKLENVLRLITDMRLDNITMKSLVLLVKDGLKE